MGNEEEGNGWQRGEERPMDWAPKGASHAGEMWFWVPSLSLFGCQFPNRGCQKTG